MFSSVAQSCQTLCNPMDCRTPGFTVLHQLLELEQLMSIELVIPSNHLILCNPLLLLPSIFPSNRVFSNESVLHISWPKYWRFNFSIGPSNEQSGLISFRIDWFDFLALEWTLKSLVQHHSSKPLILHHSPFFMVQLSHPYLTTRKIIALIILNFFSKLMSLLLKHLYRFVIVFIQTNKHLLISWLQLPSAVILEIKSVIVSTISPYISDVSTIPST